ncbi:MAG: hypothetical protein LBV69_07675 [Bacteroidales bacterium]|jgi:natural product precursor|nr:hypothetical protein [Bacteroidales bacterium]
MENKNKVNLKLTKLVKEELKSVIGGTNNNMACSCSCQGEDVTSNLASLSNTLTSGPISNKTGNPSTLKP